MIQRVFKSIGSRLTFVIAVMLLGFFLIAGTGFSVFAKIEQANDNRILLLAQARLLEEFRLNVLESIILIDRLIFEKEDKVTPRLLALNEDSLGYFGRYRSNAEKFDLKHDRYAADENEFLVYKVRDDIFEIVSLYRSGEESLAFVQRKILLEQHLKPLITFIENAAELRGFDIEDETSRIAKLKRVTAIISLTIFLLVVFLTSILAIIVHRSITGPLQNLDLVVSSFDPADPESDFNFPLNRNAEDEISRLAQSFHHLFEQLKKHEQNQVEFIAEIQQQNVELEQFNYTVSHDLKSPLVTIKGFIGLLEKDIAEGDAAKISHDIQKISVAADSMARLLEELLELSRVGRVVNPPEHISLTKLCENVADAMPVAIREHAAEIIIDSDMPEIYGDKLRLSEVMQNLFENALKFSRPDSNPKIEVSASRQQESVLVRVKDSGIGIDPDYHERIFGLFERLDTAIPGTGIGLAITKKIVEVHGGQIWVDLPDDGKGCCFCFTVPAKPDPNS